MLPVYVALGSNLNDPLQQATKAISALDLLPRTRRLAVSPFYRSSPMGTLEQPDYLNAVIMLETALAAEELLNQLQAIELQQGRQREGQRWGARTLDLDILLYGQHIINSTRLTIPHYGMKARAFVLYPLADISPALILPDGCHLQTLLANQPAEGLTRWL